MQYRIDTKRPPLVCLILLISFPSAATVLISPALPAMSHFFKISIGYTQQLMTIFVIGYALGPLIYSPFANRFGRKPAAFIGISLYLLSCLTCLAGIFTHNIEIIFIGRFLMALGSAAGMIICFTVINDFYYPEQARPIVSYTVLAYAFVPAVAVALGGFITTHFTWIDCFYFYLFYGLVMLVAVTQLPETLITKKLDALKVKPLLKSYANAFSCWRLVLFSTIYGLMGSFIYIIASAAPFIGINEIGLSPSAYGLLLLIPYAGQFVGAITAGNISKRLSPYQVMTLGYSSTIFGSILIFVSFLCHWVTVLSLMIPILFIMMGLPMTYSTVTVKALEEYEDKATGSAIMSFITMGVTVIMVFILTALPSKNPLTMPSLFMVVSVLSIIAFIHALRRFR